MSNLEIIQDPVDQSKARSYEFQYMRKTGSWTKDLVLGRRYLRRGLSNASLDKGRLATSEPPSLKALIKFLGLKQA